MNKKLLTTLLTTLLMTGFACAQDQATATTPAAATTAVTGTTTSDSCCQSKDTAACTMDTACSKEAMKKSCHGVLTKEERHRFCAAKAAAIAANPALADKRNKRALGEAICQQDPTMKPILEKLRKHCEEMRKMKKKTPVSAS